MSTSVDTDLNQIYVLYPKCTATFRTRCTTRGVLSWTRNPALLFVYICSPSYVILVLLYIAQANKMWPFPDRCFYSVGFAIRNTVRSVSRCAVTKGAGIDVTSVCTSLNPFNFIRKRFLQIGFLRFFLWTQLLQFLSVRGRSRYTDNQINVP
jgi:hypothetical protein